MAQQSIMLKIIPKICTGEEDDTHQFKNTVLDLHNTFWISPKHLKTSAVLNWVQNVLNVLKLRSNHDNANADSNSTDDVQLAVEHVSNGDWTALRSTKQLRLPDKHRPLGMVWRCYRGDEDFQSLLLGADLSTGVKHGPCRATAVQLRQRDTN